MATNPQWHALDGQQTLDRLQSNADRGLDPAEAKRRLDQHGCNTLGAPPRRHPLTLFAAQFADVVSLVLIAAALISGWVGDLADTLAILVIIVLNAGVGFVQAWRADRALYALRALAAPLATVRRGGHSLQLPASELVPGDIVLLEAGSLVPADLRLLAVHELHNDESTLTGESQPVAKLSAALTGSEAVADRHNMAFQGTLAVRGRAQGVTVATGMRTELGRVAALLAAQDDVRTPLQRRLAQLGKRLSLVVVAIAAFVFAAGLLRGEPALPMLLVALSLAVAAIPEALPAVVTIALSLGAVRMARMHALVRQLPAVETLGSITRICSDKTGTLTLNRMRAERFVCAQLESAALPVASAAGQALARALALNTDTRRQADGQLQGDPTETALIDALAAVDLDEQSIQQQWPRIAERAFDSQRKRMLTVHRNAEGDTLAVLKGAPEAVLPRCRQHAHADHERFDPGSVEATANALAAQGYRVLAVAERRWPAGEADAMLPTAGDLAPPLESLDALESDMGLLGLVALIDPPRPQAAAAVAAAQAAGIATLMITGDHPVTALAIAGQVGIDTRAAVVTGADIDQLDAAGLQQQLRQARVFARVSPEQKIRIVKSLRDSGEVVAVTGDGVNDAPALKAADVGVAMGGRGTDVARQAADLVLLDDNFATIVTAIGEGRRIYDNIRKFVKYAVTTNTGEVLTLLLAPFIGLPIPLLPIHILWINLVSDGLPGLALAIDRGDPELMQRAPRPPRESLFAQGLGFHVLWMGALIAALALLTQSWMLQQGNAHWQTLVFCVITFAQMGQVLAIRLERNSVLSLRQPPNWALLAAVSLAVVAQLAVVYVPTLNRVFHTQPLAAHELALALGSGLLVFAAAELEKWLTRRGWLYRSQPAAR